MSVERNMEYVNLGRSGLKISRIILGAMSYGSPEWQKWVLPEEEALPLLKHAFDRGITTWDTADVYSHGISEKIIAKALDKYEIPRDQVTILSKCYFGVDRTGRQPGIAEIAVNDGAWNNRVGLSRKHIIDAVDRSVERLGTYIDVLQIHRLDRATPKEEIMRALNDVVNSGKVRYIGASSMYAWEFQQLQSIAEKNGWHKFISMQNYYNLIYREEEREMIPYCKDTGVGLIPWSPLARGKLTRPWKTGNTVREQTDSASQLFEKTEENDEKVINRLEEVAKKKGISMSAVATAWNLSKGVNPIVGLSSKERIDETCENAKVKLTEEEIKYLEELYEPHSIVGH